MSGYQETGKMMQPFTPKVHRENGMALLSMNWKNGKPPADFLGFSIEYRSQGKQFFLINQQDPAFGASTTDKKSQEHTE